MARKVTFVELPVFAGVLPLASGYMQAYCMQDPVLAEAFSFEKISLAAHTPQEEILGTLKNCNSEIYAFSCYVWNSGLVRRLLDQLLTSMPSSQFMLGGPQVMHQGVRYLSPQHENVYLCNGEGERTFADFLRVLHSGTADFRAVRNLSFCREGKLITTEAEPRITDLSEIPSPFLNGLFEKGKYSWVLLETNRGCPFKCNYCYWGAATGSRVNQYQESRLRQEIEWISQSQCWYLFIADANWGMLKRDVELSRYLVDCQKLHGAPFSVYFCGSKNTPERVAEITQIFHDAGMISTQSVALQTMNPETLIRVRRENIKTSAYTQMQQSLNERGIASFVEMIWPLPGETVASFQEGLAQLCALCADSFVVYPLLLMNNVDLATQRDALGLVTIKDPDPNSEAEIVIGTSEVDLEAYREGLLYTYAVMSLHVLRGLWNLGRYLNTSGLLSYRDLFSSFVQFSSSDPSRGWTRFCRKSIENLEHARFSNTGQLVHLILHAQRDEFDDLLEDFCTSSNFWNDPLAEFFFEVDLLHRPYVYRNTPIAPKKHKFRRLKVLDQSPQAHSVEVPEEYFPQLALHLGLSPSQGPPYRFAISHRRSQLPFMPAKSLHDHYLYCQDMSQRMTTFLPLWSAARPMRATG